MAIATTNDPEEQIKYDVCVKKAIFLTFDVKENKSALLKCTSQVKQAILYFPLETTQKHGIHPSR